MSAASELIERLERETGHVIAANDGDNMAMAGVIGAMSRMLGQSPTSYTERDDVAAGLLIGHQMSPAGQRERESKEMLANLIIGGMSPDTIKDLVG
ncbi:MAG TPA: hypothetical protein VLA24_09345 [Pseudomonadales bacterium]|nr:hypothetical protein [Pseudomonadales bacterium]